MKVVGAATRQHPSSARGSGHGTVEWTLGLYEARLTKTKPLRYLWRKVRVLQETGVFSTISPFASSGSLDMPAEVREQGERVAAALGLPFLAVKDKTPLTVAEALLLALEPLEDEMSSDS